MSECENECEYGCECMCERCFAPDKPEGEQCRCPKCPCEGTGDL